VFVAQIELREADTAEFVADRRLLIPNAIALSIDQVPLPRLNLLLRSDVRRVRRQAPGRYL
jgi:hypothetical protein